jgi:hypothetical protein
LMVTGRVADDDAVPKAINSACDRRDINCKRAPSVTAHTHASRDRQLREAPT